jgi:hypothetical protein
LALGFRELCARVALRFGQGFPSRLLGFHEPGLGVGKITIGRACRAFLALDALPT